MNQERNFFFENDDDNKANGYYERSLNKSKIDSTLKSLDLNYFKTTYGCNQKTAYRKT